MIGNLSRWAIAPVSANASRFINNRGYRPPARCFGGMIQKTRKKNPVLTRSCDVPQVELEPSRRAETGFASFAGQMKKGPASSSPGLLMSAIRSVSRYSAGTMFSSSRTFANPSRQLRQWPLLLTNTVCRGSQNHGWGSIFVRLHLPQGLRP